MNVSYCEKCKTFIVQIDEMVDPEKQQFLQDKARKAETKDIVVEGKEEIRKEKREDNRKEGKGEKEEQEEEENNLDPVISSESLKVET